MGREKEVSYEVWYTRKESCWKRIAEKAIEENPLFSERKKKGMIKLE